ncbi:hypothetical protein NM688_g1337 [Phlebia brevispora]|uniref:Uncharacterized protein n=1 Tax=Phlebia brevispora TaxID=194682 RepID=A0ACC1TBW5_9APHY|nr:hypothetical protein NM688_g1337 [Phlebia brevispora]
MTGMLQIKGELATYYKETPRKASTDWPPRFMKFIFHLGGKNGEPVTELAFLDARRLGRIRLCKSPLTEPPISTLGFDPILSMPPLEDFKQRVRKRSCPIKALLLDQSFSAGVGNWVADEILYHARVHPEHRCNTLSDENLENLHQSMVDVCRIAVEVNADDSKFPENWLFKHRWGKGKKKHTLMLPSGEPATIKWITVGGRTSAYVAELQGLGTNGDIEGKDDPKKRGKRKRKTANDSDSDLTPLEESADEETEKAPQAPREKVNIKKSKYFTAVGIATSGSRRITRQMSRMSASIEK